MSEEQDRELYDRVKAMLVRDLRLKVAPEDIANDAVLFEDKALGLDSVDALELVVALEKEFGVRISDTKIGQEVLVSVDTLVAYIKKNQEPGS